MGIVSDSEFESDLSNTGFAKSIINEGQVIDQSIGRPKGSNEVPESLRAIIGEESVINGRESGLNIASRFGISPSSVSAYAKGATSTSSYNKPSEEIKNHIERSKERISSKARNRLIKALNHITEDKLESAKVSELSGVAKDMSVIIKAMEPDIERANVMSGPTFVVYAPTIRKEETFDVIYSKE